MEHNAKCNFAGRTKKWKTQMENKTDKSQYLFTSEVVSPGHPDKCADIIADSIVDELIIKDKTQELLVKFL